MKRIIYSIYFSSFVFSFLFLAAAILDYRYIAWEAIIALKEGLVHLILSSLLTLVLIAVSFSGLNKINKKNFYQYLLLLLSLIYILVNIILYPYMRVFVGSKLLILLIVIAFMPITVLTFLLLYKEFFKIYKNNKNKALGKNKGV